VDGLEKVAGGVVQVRGDEAGPRFFGHRFAAACSKRRREGGRGTNASSIGIEVHADDREPPSSQLLVQLRRQDELRPGKVAAGARRSQHQSGRAVLYLITVGLRG